MSERVTGQKSRVVWGVLFDSGITGRPLGPLFGNWHPGLEYPHYAGEPQRLVSFTTRAAARAFCAVKNAEWQARKDFVRRWRLRPVRVREQWAVVT